MSDKQTILVVEDDSDLREALIDTLELSGLVTTEAGSAEEALALLEKNSYGLILSDVQMTGVDGHSLLRTVKQHWPETPFVLMTAYGSVARAVEAMRDGAADYISKPFEAEVLIEMVSRLALDDRSADKLLAADERSRQLAATALRVAVSDATVLLSGESGTGKEVYARFIHENSSRRSGPFIAINCAAIPESMLESILFGYEKGAFTGAYQARAGKFEQAQGGTLLLDEISEMDLGLQAKLLRVLQEKEVERLGSRHAVPLDIRLIATTNRRLREAVAEGQFREDLFYRISVFPLAIPPPARTTRRYPAPGPDLYPALCRGRSSGTRACCPLAPDRT